MVIIILLIIRLLKKGKTDVEILEAVRAKFGQGVDMDVKGIRRIRAEILRGL